MGEDTSNSMYENLMKLYLSNYETQNSQVSVFVFLACALR
jgi:hypothetical protein